MVRRESSISAFATTREETSVRPTLNETRKLPTLEERVSRLEATMVEMKPLLEKIGIVMENLNSEVKEMRGDMHALRGDLRDIKTRLDHTPGPLMIIATVAAVMTIFQIFAVYAPQILPPISNS